MVSNSKEKRPKGPRVSLALVPLAISEKEIKIRAELYNSDAERMIRFLFNGISTTDAIETTEEKRTEHTFEIPPNTLDAIIRAETIGEPRVWDEIKIVPVATKKKKETTEKKMLMEIFGPCGDDKCFFISAQTEPEEKIILNSTTPLTLSGIGVTGEQAGTSFVLQADDNGIISLKAITSKDAALQFKKNNETEKRLLVI